VKHDTRAEWLEADGLGGFASGTASGIRTRRYHALLLHAATPPTGGRVLVNGLEAWLEGPAGRCAISSQAYMPDVVHPDGASRIARFRHEPWPCWTFALPDGSHLVHELFVPHESAAVVLHWQLDGAPRGFHWLRVRPLLSGRDYHALQRENGAFRFAPRAHGGLLAWQPYPDIAAVWSHASGAYAHDPLWYRAFRYDEERARGLDFVEDLASPGVLSFDLREGPAAWVLAADGHEAVLGREGESARAVADRLRAQEEARRKAFPGALARAADAYVVRRGSGRTLVAGYPWFTDWGRDTFIALRGLCLASGRLDVAREILLAWADHVSDGMLPNLFPDGAAQPEYNSVDASLWYVVAAHEWLAAARRRGTEVGERERVFEAVDAIVAGYARGTRFGIRMDSDGLLACGVPGVQLTWMDAKVGDWVVTPRIGKPVEVQALWYNALRLVGERVPEWARAAGRVRASFAERFWDPERAQLFDVVDVDHQSGATDDSLRPNQIFAVGGLPFALLDGERARQVVERVEAQLWTPLGLRSLAPGSRDYAPRYHGGVRERDGAYHQGTVWPWLTAAFADAWLAVRGRTPAARLEAQRRFAAPLLAHLEHAGLGHVSEIADGDAPHEPRGCPFQAWSLGELLRLLEEVLAAEPPGS
jgi:predicted glycogen debranching enzyme